MNGRSRDPFPFYEDDAAFDGLERRSAQLLNLLMKRGPDRGYFPEPAKSLFILDTLVQEVAAGIEFEAEVLALNFVSGSRYLGAYLVPQEELAEWVKPQAEAWTHCVSVFGKNLDGARYWTRYRSEERR